MVIKGEKRTDFLTMFSSKCHACGFEKKCKAPRLHSLKDFWEDGGCGCWENATENVCGGRARWNYHCNDGCQEGCHYCRYEMMCENLLD